MAVNRRDFIKVSGAFAAWAALSACQPVQKSVEAAVTSTVPVPSAVPSSTLTPTAAPLPNVNLLELTLKRTSYGVTPELREHALRIGLDAYINEQLHPETIADNECDNYLKPYRTLGMNTAERWKLISTNQVPNELMEAIFIRQRHSQRQLQEVMAEFWSNHFNIYIYRGLCKILKTDDDLHVIRPNIFSTYGNLLQASAQSPAMLSYLDNALSGKDSPNENYARELMELHTIGVDGGYTQEDVREVARILTGWTFSNKDDSIYSPGVFKFDHTIHDYGRKIVLGNVFPPGSGMAEGYRLIEMLSGHPMAAQFICTKLARRFISDTPDPAAIGQFAAEYLRTGGDIRAVLTTIFKSDAFKYSSGQKFKSPVEFLVSSLRLTDTKFTGSTQKFTNYLKAFGHRPFTWLTPDGFPDNANFWATCNGLVDRWNFGMMLTHGWVKGAKVDLKAMTRDAGSPEDVIDVLSRRFLGDVLPADARSILVDYYRSGKVKSILPITAGLILGSPHFQVR